MLVRMIPEIFAPETFYKMHQMKMEPHKILKKLGINAYLVEFLEDMKIGPIFKMSNLTTYPVDKVEDLQLSSLAKPHQLEVEEI